MDPVAAQQLQRPDELGQHATSVRRRYRSSRHGARGRHAPVGSVPVPRPAETSLTAFAIALGTVFVAELGDKSQLLALAFATRHRAGRVLVGVAVASVLVQGASVALGLALRAALPTDAITVAAGVVFLLVAAWTLRDRDEDLELPQRSRGGVIATVATTFVVAELGDKTMLATLALAARYGPLPVWAGGAAGMFVANALAVVVGRQLGARIRPDRLRLVTAALFAAVGVALLVSVWWDG